MKKHRKCKGSPITVREVRHAHKCRKCSTVYRHASNAKPRDHRCPRCGTVNRKKYEATFRYEPIQHVSRATKKVDRRRRT